MQEISLDETTILDFGSGSGILAVAAGLLGSHNIYYHDIDQQALDATASNLTAHHLNSKVKIYDPKQSSIQHDVVFANILCAPLIENRDLFFNLLKDHGTLITSGVIEEQSEHFAKHFSQKFTLSKHLKINEWHSYLWIKS